MESLISLLPMVAIFAVMYFMVIRPQQKKQKDHHAMLAAIEKGQEVVTSGGVVGKVTKATDHELTIEVAKGVEVQVLRSMIALVRTSKDDKKPAKKVVDKS